MQITAWKCDTTGKIFEQKSKYQYHLKKLAADRRSKAQHEAFETARKQIFVDMRNTVRTPLELVAFIEANWQSFCMNAIVNDWRKWGRKDKFKKVAHPNLRFFKLKSFRWNDCISNSHSCPIGGVQNWGGKVMLPDGSPAPRNYPGWHMDIEYNTVNNSDDKYDSSYPYSSELWEGTGVHTGCGGYAANYYFQCNLFASDWPAMAEAYEAAQAWAILNNDRRKIDELVIALYHGE